MKLLDVLTNSTDFLAKKGVESPRLQAELILSHALGKIPRMQLYLQFERDLQEPELALIRPLLKRRSLREPIQHITGETSFYGHRILCSPAALIPRPETELLVEKISTDLKNLPAGKFYDVGTGTGIIPIALAHQFPNWKFIAFDISDDALALAKQNHSIYPTLPIEWLKNDLLENISEQADAIVANLPYLNAEEMKSLQPEVQSDPKLALDGGSDGLDLIRRLIPQAIKLSPRLYLETGIHHVSEAAKLAQEAGFSQVQILKDLAERERFVIATR